MRENKFWIFRTYREMIIAIILFPLFIAGFIYISTINFHKDEIKDNEKFITEHKEVIDPENIYVYVNSQEAYTLVREDNVLLLFGVKDNNYVGHYANILNEVAKSLEIEKIYYYDITEDRLNKNATYESIVKYLDGYVPHFDDGTANIYAPAFLIKTDGVVTYYYDDTAIIKGNIKADEYWNEYQVNLAKLYLDNALKDYIRSQNGE